MNLAGASALARAAEYGRTYRQKVRPLHPTAGVDDLRAGFCTPLPETGEDGAEVIGKLIAAAEPGLVGNTDPNFFAWVMGGSDPVGVAADWLTSSWGQNAAIYQTSPAAAVAEEAVSAWLLDLLDLPRDSSVGLVTGATMAAFVGCAAARSEVLRRAGWDLEQDGLQGAPKIHVLISDDAHVTNFSALRYLGFGEANFVRVNSDEAGLMDPDALARAMASHTGPKIVVAQAGHINSGGFEDFERICNLAQTHDTWVHVDGAFGMWARVLPGKAYLTRGIERADSWSVDGHKWLQIPYDSGFAIVRHPDAHRRAMDISAAYLNRDPDDGRNPTEYGPELSRRARGFAAWAVLRNLGREGVQKTVQRHCEAARIVSEGVDRIPGLRVSNKVEINQIIVETEGDDPDGILIARLAERLNDRFGVFVRTSGWKGRVVMRISVTSRLTGEVHADALTGAIQRAWQEVGGC